MLPLRGNRKPQLIPIKALLSKQRDNPICDDTTNNFNTDDYLLWKAEHEPSSRQSVTSDLRNLDNMMNEVSNVNTKFQVHMNDTLWDSDENSFRGLMNSKDLSPDDEYRTMSAIDICKNTDVNRTRKMRKNAGNSSRKMKQEEMIQKLVETLLDVLNQRIEDIESNLKLIIVEKTENQISHLEHLIDKNQNKLKFTLEQNLTQRSTDENKIEFFTQKTTSHINDIKNEINNFNLKLLDDVKREINREISEMTKKINDNTTKIEQITINKSVDNEEHHYSEDILNNLNFLTKNFENMGKKIDSIIASKELSKPVGDSFILEENIKHDFYDNIDAELKHYQSILFKITKR